MKRTIFFFFALLLATSVLAAAPTVDFNFSPAYPDKLQTILFHPIITSSPSLISSNWQFALDGNQNFLDQNIIAIAFDDFSDGNFLINPVWTENSGSEDWTILLGRLYTNKNGAIISLGIAPDYNIANKKVEWDFNMSLNVTGTGKVTIDLVQKGADYVSVSVSEGGDNIILVASSGGLLISGPVISSGISYDVNVTSDDSNFSLYVDDVYYGSVVNRSTVVTETIFKLTNQTSDSTALDEMKFIGAGAATVDVFHSFSTDGNKLVCLTGTNADGATTVCRGVMVTDFNTSLPVISQFDYNYLTGFNIADVNDHFVLKCDSNYSTVNMKLTVNGSTALDTNQAPGRIYVDVNAQSGRNNATFTCKVSDSAQASESKTFYLYTSTFWIVNERTGAPITIFSDFNSIRLTSYDLNQWYDFNSVSDAFVKISSLVSDIVRLDINYINTIQESKEFNLTVLSPDNNIGMCVAQPYEQPYQQIFTSSSNSDGIILRHSLSNCYALADYTKYAYGSLYAAITYTITSPYYLQFYDGNTKIMLTNIDGSIPLTHNLQTLSLNQTQYSVDLVLDTLSVSPKVNVNTGIYDENVVQIFYHSPRNVNQSVVLRIYLANTLLWSHTETAAPNSLLIDWDYSAYGLSDNNTMRITVEKTSILGATETNTYYFTLGGQVFSGTLDATVAAMLAVILVIFGLTFVSSQLSFGWFGMLIMLGAIFILALAPAFWWITLLQFIFLIIIVWIALSGNHVPGVS